MLLESVPLPLLLRFTRRAERPEEVVELGHRLEMDLSESGYLCAHSTHPRSRDFRFLARHMPGILDYLMVAEPDQVRRRNNTLVRPREIIRGLYQPKS